MQGKMNVKGNEVCKVYNEKNTKYDANSVLSAVLFNFVNGKHRTETHYCSDRKIREHSVEGIVQMW